jgi:hypothetical protein
VTIDQGWPDAIDRYQQDPSNAVAELNVALLSALRDRWEPVIHVETSMLFDLNLTPAGRTVRDVKAPLSFVQVRHQSPADNQSGLVVKVSLVQYTPRASLSEPGGHATVAGDLCRAENAPVVVESFLFQIADPDQG